MHWYLISKNTHVELSYKYDDFWKDFLKNISKFFKMEIELTSPQNFIFSDLFFAKNYEGNIIYRLQENKPSINVFQLSVNTTSAFIITIFHFKNHQ